LEVTRNRLLELGLRYPQSLAVSLVGAGAAGAAGTPGSVTLREWHDRNADLVRLTFTDPLFILSLHQQDGRTNVLANPRIRVKNKEKAHIHIGDRVPVITTTAAATGGFVSESVTYLDVGLKLEVEPQIYLEDEVGIKVGLEVSNIVNSIKSTSGTLTYQIGTRNATTTPRLARSSSPPAPSPRRASRALAARPGGSWRPRRSRLLRSPLPARGRRKRVRRPRLRCSRRPRRSSCPSAA